MGCGASTQPAPRISGNKAYPVQQQGHQQRHLHLQQQKPTQHVQPTPQQKACSSLPQLEKKDGKCDKIVRAASSCSLISQKSVKSKSSASTNSSRSSLKDTHKDSDSTDSVKSLTFENESNTAAGTSAVEPSFEDEVTSGEEEYSVKTATQIKGNGGKGLSSIAEAPFEGIKDTELGSKEASLGDTELEGNERKTITSTIAAEQTEEAPPEAIKELGPIQDSCSFQDSSVEKKPTSDSLQEEVVFFIEQLAPANNTVAAAPVAMSQSQQQPAEKPKPTPVITDNSPEEKTEIEMKPVDINKELLEKYMALEKEIHEKENKNVVKALQVKKKEVAELSDTIQQLEEHYKKCVEQTKKEKADVDNAPSVQQLLNAEEYQAMLTKEQEEYLDAVNNEEIAKKQWVGVTAQRDKVAKEVEEMKLAAEALQKLYKEQDELLASVFNGKYGSEKEYKLESELDMLLDHHQRVSVAKYKWQNARTLLQHGCNQLSFACKKWLELLKVQQNDVPRKYTITTETRNNLIAASQNITSAQRYLHGITFPYCTKAEMDTLTKATTNIYSDMTPGDRHQHAYQCYLTTYKRCAALIQWFDHVINNTINKDIANATKKVNEKEKELRQERVTLLIAKVKEVLGTDVVFTVSDENMFDDSVEEKELVDIIDADAVSTNGEDVEKPEGVITGNELAPGDNDSISATPLPLNELAPPPSQEDLFGDIEELKKQHEREMEEFQRAQEINKARMDQGLQEKLKARRSRRQRQEALEVSS